MRRRALRLSLKKERKKEKNQTDGDQGGGKDGERESSLCHDKNCLFSVYNVAYITSQVVLIQGLKKNVSRKIITQSSIVKTKKS